MCKMHQNKKQQKKSGEIITKIKEEWLVGIFKVKIMCKMHQNKKQQKIRAKLLPRSKKNGLWVSSRQKLYARCTKIRNNKKFGRSYYQDQRRMACGYLQSKNYVQDAPK